MCGQAMLDSMMLVVLLLRKSSGIPRAHQDHSKVRCTVWHVSGF